MGQYFKYINLDKKEFLTHKDNSSKLMEWGWEMNPICMEVKALLATRWKGDHVHLIGDYYDDDEDAFIALKHIIESDPILTSISKRHLGIYGQEGQFNAYNLFHSKYSEIKKIECEESNQFIGYVAYNHSKREFCDLSVGVFERISFRMDTIDDDKASIHMWRIDPLNILLAINATGGGGGYFSDACKDLVGSWAFDDIELFTLENDPKLPDYTPILANFTENEIAYPIEDAPNFFKLNRFPSLVEFKDYFSNHIDELRDLISKPYFDLYMNRYYEKDSNVIFSLCGLNDSDLNNTEEVCL